MQYRTIILLFLTIFSTQFAFGQEDWNIPEDRKSKLSPFEFTDSVIEAGKKNFYSMDMGNCVSCHGDPGKENWQKLVPSPGDPADTKFQANLDGELHYKISEGRGLMPSFKNTLDKDEIWSVIAYIRSFNNNYAQKIAQKVQKTGYNGSVDIVLSLLNDKTIQTKVIGTKDNNTETLKNIEVKLSAKRWFGSLPIEESKFTNLEGVVNFKVPADVPGDSLGYITVIAQLTDLELFGAVSKEASFSVGKPTNKPSLVAKRAMWNKVKMAPLWILITYAGGVLGAWSIIFYVLFQLKKIFMIGSKDSTKE